MKPMTTLTHIAGGKIVKRELITKEWGDWLCKLNPDGSPIATLEQLDAAAAKAFPKNEPTVEDNEDNAEWIEDLGSRYRENREID